MAITTAVAATIYLAFATTYTSVQVELRAEEDNLRSSVTVGRQKQRGATLAEVNGARVYVLLLAPVLLAAIPLATPPRYAIRAAASFASAGTLLLFVALTGFSIGLYYTASALAASVAAVAAASADRAEN